MAGLFITLEGIDGCGKSTQARLLAEWLRGLGHHVVLTHEPGGTRAGEGLRALLLAPEGRIPAAAELFLYLADRAMHVAEVIRPALAQGRVVVCERYTDSTLAYQGAGRGLGTELVRQLSGLATGGLVPDLTVVLDVAPGQARLDEGRLDRLESEGRQFRARVAAAFRRLAEEEPQRVKLVDGAAEVGVVHEKVAGLVVELLRRRPLRQSEPREDP